MLLNRKGLTLILWILMLILTSGCDDEHTAQIAREAADRQAQQNTTMAELHQQVASGTRQLVEADAQARTEIVGVHRDLQAERTRLATGWNALEAERQQIAGERRTESVLVPATTYAGGVVLLTVLLRFCWHNLVAVRRDDDADVQLNELLIGEILSDEPSILNSAHPPVTLLGHDRRGDQLPM